MIRYGGAEYIDGIKNLWAEAFGDSVDQIEKYLRNMYCEKDILLYVEDDEVCAMASMLGVSSKNIKGRYIYAVATAKKYRGRGICKKLMSRIEEEIKARGEEFSILVPAEKSLFEFYKKLGYSQTVFKPKETKYKLSDGECSAREYFSIRENLFKDYDLIEWDEKSLEYILSLGETKILENGAGYFENGKPIEILTPKIFEKEWTEPFALIKYINEDLVFEKPYFGLSMG